MQDFHRSLLRDKFRSLALVGLSYEEPQAVSLAVHIFIVLSCLVCSSRQLACGFVVALLQLLLNCLNLCPLTSKAFQHCFCQTHYSWGSRGLWSTESTVIAKLKQHSGLSHETSLELVTIPTCLTSFGRAKRATSKPKPRSTSALRPCALSQPG